MEQTTELRLKKISNDPTFTDVKRYVEVMSEVKTKFNIQLSCILRYEKDNEEITNKFNNKIYTLIADNFQRKNVYTLNGETIYDFQEGATKVTQLVEVQESIDNTLKFNEDGSPKMISVEEDVTIGNYDYFKLLMNKPISTYSQYDAVILQNDEKGKFNEL